MLRHWSQLLNGVSGLISRWGGELRHFLLAQQGSQTSLSVAPGNSEFHSSLPWNQSLCRADRFLGAFWSSVEVVKVGRAEGEHDILST